MNKHDFLMFALDDAITSLGQTFTLRLKERHGVKEIREAIRYMISIYPRLRSIVEPTLFSYQLKIFDDGDRQLNVLFNDAFRVRHGLKYNSPEYLEYRKNLMNEPFSLQQGLPIKIRYIPDDYQPVLLFSIHHMVCDGKSIFHLLNSMLSYMNGKKPPYVPLDNPSQLPALVQKPFYKIPGQILRSYTLLRHDLIKNKGQKIIPASSKPADFFGPANLNHYTLPYDVDTVKAKARKLGFLSINVFLLAALAIVLGKGPGKDRGDIIGIPFSIDLRPFFTGNPPVFGNFVSNFWFRIHKKYWNNPKEMLNEIRKQFHENIRRYKHKEMIVPMTMEKLNTFVGRKYFTMGARIALKKGLLPITCDFSTLGNLDQLNSHGPFAQLADFIVGFPQHGLFLFYITIDNTFYISFTYPEAEFSKVEIDTFFQSFSDTLGQLLEI